MPSTQQFFTNLLVAFVFAYWLLGDNKKKDQRQSDMPFNRDSVRVVSEAELINHLSTGNYSPELIISREVVYNQNGGKNIYQTICLAK